jgi:hypothetical protein
MVLLRHEEGSLGVGGQLLPGDARPLDQLPEVSIGGPVVEIGSIVLCFEELGIGSGTDAKFMCVHTRRCRTRVNNWNRAAGKG